jgi:hypothetical protein
MSPPRYRNADRFVFLLRSPQHRQRKGCARTAFEALRYLVPRLRRECQGEGAVGVWRVLLEGRVLSVRD